MASIFSGPMTSSWSSMAIFSMVPKSSRRLSRSYSPPSMSRIRKVGLTRRISSLIDRIGTFRAAEDSPLGMVEEPQKSGST